MLIMIRTGDVNKAVFGQSATGITGGDNLFENFIFLCLVSES